MMVVYRSGDAIPWARLLLPWQVALSLTRHGVLIRQLVKREILSRYRGTFLGVFWSLLRPLAMLSVYTLVFGFILEPRVEAGTNLSKLELVFSLFCALILFEFVSECLNRAPMLVLMHPNYVKKVVFPLEILPVSAVGAALLQMAISFVPFFVGLAIVRGGVPATALWLPLVLLPLVLFALGLSWFLASVSVFIRDTAALIPVATMVLLFASGVFYSLDHIPVEFRGYFLLNPIAVLINEARHVVLLQMPPAWGLIGVNLAASIMVATAAYAFFMSTKRGFADVM